MIIGIFSHFFAVETTLAERQFFRALAKLIGRRAARLSSCGIAAIVGKMGYLDEGCEVGADGSLYNVRSSYLWRSFRWAAYYVLLCRNGLVLLTGYMRVLSIFLARKEGNSLFILPFWLVLDNLKKEYCYSSRRGWQWCWQRYNCRFVFRFSIIPPLLTYLN